MKSRFLRTERIMSQYRFSFAWFGLNRNLTILKEQFLLSRSTYCRAPYCRSRAVLATKIVGSRAAGCRLAKSRSTYYALLVGIHEASDARGAASCRGSRGRQGRHRGQQAGANGRRRRRCRCCIELCVNAPIRLPQNLK